MKAEHDQLLRLAAFFLDAGLARTARRFLLRYPNLKGRSLNTLRAMAKTRSGAPGITPGIFSLTLDRDIGLVVPLQARRGGQRQGECLDQEARLAQKRAFQAAVELVGGCSPDRICLELVIPDMMRLEGRSLGLPAALAFFARLTGRSPGLPVVAMGEVTPEGVVVAVEGARAKLDAAQAELDGAEGLVLAHSSDADQAPGGLEARPVGTVREAVGLVFGPGPWFVDPTLISLEALFAALRGETNHEQAIRLLEGHGAASLPLTDRARLLIERGRRLRHLGRTSEASQLHAEARALFDEAQQVLGRTDVEVFEMETLSTAVDEFDYKLLEPALRDRLEQPFATLHNQVRCRGMLAQVLASTRRAAEALELRLENLKVQHLSEAMSAEIPQTLCYITWTAACAGDRGAFDEAAHRLLAEARPGDVHQERYTGSALIRGLVRLGRDREALDWATGDLELWGHGVYQGVLDLLEGSDTIVSHPEVSTARALIRALRRTGSPDRALPLSARVTAPEDQPLVAWLAELANIEEGLTRWSMGDHAFAEIGVAEVIRRLERLEPNAARFHAPLITALGRRPLDAGAIAAIEEELDWVYY
jgi:hypothetical protein